MTITAQTIKKMSRREQLRLMEVLWGELSKDENSIEWPARHEEELARREAATKKGQNPSSPWKEVKRRLREKLSLGSRN